MNTVIVKPAKKFSSAKGNPYIRVDGAGDSGIVMLQQDELDQWDNIKTLTIGSYKVKTHVEGDADDVFNGPLVDRYVVIDFTTRGSILADKKFDIELDQLVRKGLKESVLDASEVGELEAAI